MEAQSSFPKSRHDDLLIERVGVDTVVYDPSRRAMHSLNTTAASVWRHCDGESSVPQVAERVSDDLGAHTDNAVVEYALDRLAGANLLERGTDFATRGVTRRAMLQRLSASVAVPVVLSMIAPTPAMAASAPGGPIDPGPDFVPTDPGEDF